MRPTEERKHIYRKTTLGILYNFGGKNFGFVLSFIFTIIIARHLGPSDYGSYSFYRNAAAFLALFTILGLESTMVHFVPAIRQSGNDRQLKPLVRKSFVLASAGLCIMALFAIIIFYIVPLQMGYGEEFSPEIMLLFLVLLIVITFSAIQKGVISGMFHQKFLNIVEMGSVQSKLVLTLIFFSIGLMVEGVMLAVVIAYGLPSILYFGHTRKEFTEIRNRERETVNENVPDNNEMTQETEEGEVERERGRGGENTKEGVGESERTEVPDDRETHANQLEAKWLEMRRYALIMIIFTASYIVLDNQIDIIMLKFLSGNSEAGYYNIAFRFAFINAMVFIAAIDGVLVPTFTSLKKEDRRHQRKALHNALRYTLFFLIPIATAGCMFADQLIEIFFGEDYSDSVVMLRVLYATLVISMALSWPIRFLMVSIGWEKKILIIYVAYALLNFLGNLILIPLYGGLGAVLATGFTSLLISLHLIMEVKKLGLLEFPLPFMLKTAAASLIAISPFYFLLPFLGNFPTLAGGYIAFCSLYFVVNLLLKGITKDELIALWKMVKESGLQKDNN